MKIVRRASGVTSILSFILLSTLDPSLGSKMGALLFTGMIWGALLFLATVAEC